MCCPLFCCAFITIDMERKWSSHMLGQLDILLHLNDQCSVFKQGPSECSNVSWDDLGPLVPANAIGKLIRIWVIAEGLWSWTQSSRGWLRFGLHQKQAAMGQQAQAFFCSLKPFPLAPFPIPIFFGSLSTSFDLAAIFH